MRANCLSWDGTRLIVSKMTDLTPFLDKNIKLDVYTGGNIHGLYFYMRSIGYPNTLTTSGHCSHHIGPSSSTNNYTESIQTVIAALLVRKNNICELFGRIGHKADA